MEDWSRWESSGDCVHAPDRPGSELTQLEVLRRVAVGFPRVVIDWPQGHRWAEARAAKAAEDGYRGFLLDAEHALRDTSVLVSVADAPGPDAACARFFLTPDAGMFELYYEPSGAESACRGLARKLAELLEYEFAAWDDSDDTESGDAPDEPGMQAF